MFQQRQAGILITGLFYLILKTVYSLSLSLSIYIYKKQPIISVKLPQMKHLYVQPFLNNQSEACILR